MTVGSSISFLLKATCSKSVVLNRRSIEVNVLTFHCLGLNMTNELEIDCSILINVMNVVFMM